jgi:hypothetical protein
MVPLGMESNPGSARPLIANLLDVQYEPNRPELLEDVADPLCRPTKTTVPSRKAKEAMQ